MKQNLRHFALAVVWCTFLGARTQSAAWAGENWPYWRGPNRDGTSDSTNLPTTWSLQRNENIVWKAELPSWSGSTPIIWGDTIFVVSPSKSEGVAATGDEGQKSGERAAGDSAKKSPPGKGFGEKGFGGKGFGGSGGKGFGGRGFGGKGFGGYSRMSDPGGQQLLLLCLSKKDGSLRWQRQIDEGNQIYQKQNSTSPSPVTDGKTVWVLTGNGVVTALDFDGKVLWKRDLQKEYGPFGLNWGYGSSPLLWEGKVIIQVLHGMRTDDPSYLVAFDGASGNVVWRTERPTDAIRESPDAYTTPTVLTTAPKPQIIVSGGDYVTGHDPDTGAEIWRAAGLNPNRDSAYRTVASPTVVGEMIVACTRRRPMIALRTGGTGDVTGTHTAWKFDQGPDVPSPVSDGKHLYVVDDGGVAHCLDLKTGAKVWGPERLNVGATISASPRLADGKIYVTGENAVTVVIAAGPEYKHLATNDLDGTFTLSSIAVSGEHLFVRTATHLYCIGNQP